MMNTKEALRLFLIGSILAIAMGFIQPIVAGFGMEWTFSVFSLTAAISAAISLAIAEWIYMSWLKNMF